MFPSVFTVNCCLLFTCLRWADVRIKKGLATKTNPLVLFLLFCLLRTEDTVARIAKARKDVVPFVQALV